MSTKDRFHADAIAYRADCEGVDSYAGTTVIDDDGMEWMVVATRGRWLVLENEDERTKQVLWSTFERWRARANQVLA